MNIQNPKEEKFCNKCFECSGFLPHYWNQINCAACRHPFDDHLWKRGNRTENISAFETAIHNQHGNKVILYNDECHSFEEVATTLIKAYSSTEKSIEQEHVEELVNQAHINGGSVVFSGSLDDCNKVRDSLRSIDLETDIEYCYSEDYQPRDKIVLLRYSNSYNLSMGVLLSKLSSALVCSKDKCRYLLHVAAQKPDVQIHCGPLQDCVLIKNIIKPIECEIRDRLRSPLSLLDKCQLLLISTGIEKTNLSMLPQEIVENLLTIAWKSGTLSFPQLKMVLQSCRITELNLSNHPDHSLFFGDIKRAHLRIIASHNSLTSLNLSGSKLEVSSLHELSNLPLISLYLDNTSVTDESLSCFTSGFKNLRYLSLIGCTNLSNSCLTYLSRVKLQRLNITKTGISKESIDRLKQDLPNLVTDIDDTSTHKPKKKEKKKNPIIDLVMKRVYDRLPNDRNIPQNIIQQYFQQEFHAALLEPNAHSLWVQMLLEEQQNEDEDEDDQEEEEEDEENVMDT